MNDVDTFVEVKLKTKEKFLMIMETLTRIGVPSEKNKTLWQSCHILQKRGKYYIVHFKELFALDGYEVDITEDDIARRNKIILFLEECELVIIVDPEKVESPVADKIKIIKYDDKKNWTLKTKYTMKYSRK